LFLTVVRHSPEDVGKTLEVFHTYEVCFSTSPVIAYEKDAGNRGHKTFKNNNLNQDTWDETDIKQAAFTNENVYAVWHIRILQQ